MDRAQHLTLDRTGLVDRIADHVDDAAQEALPDRHRDRRTGVGHLLAAHQAFGDIHGDGADGVLAQVLGDFEHQTVAAVLGLERVQDRRQVIFELHVDDGADDLGDLSNCIGRSHGHVLLQTSGAQTTVNVTGTLPRVAREYGQILWASSTSA